MQQEKKPQKQTHNYMGNQSTTTGIRQYNGEKTACSVNTVGETGQLHAKE